MPIRGNITKKDYEYTCIDKEHIFEVNANYGIALKVNDIWTKNKSLFIEVGFNNAQKGTLQFNLFEHNIMNIKFYQAENPAGHYYDKTFKHLSSQDIDWENLNDKVLIKLANDEKLVINKNKFRLSLLDKDGLVKTETSLKWGHAHLDGFSTPPLGVKEKDNSSKPFISFQISTDELFYGLGEKFNNLVKNGIQSVVFNTNVGLGPNGDWAYGGVPLIYSTKNWGLLLNTGAKTTWEIGAPVTESLVMMSDDDCLDMVLFTGNSIKDLISQYTLLTGRISGVPDEGYGLWVNRLYYHNYNELFTEINNSIENNYPMDVFTLDPKWLKNRYTKSCNFIFNDDAFGDAKKFFDDVHQKGFKMCFWLDPYLQIDNSKTWKEAFENGYYTKTESGDIAKVWAGMENYQDNLTAVDLTNPAAYTWWKEKIKDYLKLGLDFVKTDYGDGVGKDVLYFNGEKGENFRQPYIELYLKAAYEATIEVHGEGKGFSLARPGYIGTHQYVGKWAGDSVQSFSDLKMQFLSGMSNSLNGTVMWGTDIGGFEKDSSNLFEQDLYARWSEFGLLTPFSRYHGIGKREPWYFGNENFEISKKYAELKRQLLPYYKKFEKEAIETGLPILRPLVLEFQDDFIAQKIDDQFMLGSDLIIAPIFTNKTYKRQVYLPKGEWIDFFDKTVYEGNKVYEVDCPIDKILIFVKSGVSIPMMENSHYKYKDLDIEKIILNKFGEIKEQTLEFKLNYKDYKIVIKDDEIIETNKKELELI